MPWWGIAFLVFVIGAALLRFILTVGWYLSVSAALALAITIGLMVYLADTNRDIPQRWALKDKRLRRALLLAGIYCTGFGLLGLPPAMKGASHETILALRVLVLSVGIGGLHLGWLLAHMILSPARSSEPTDQ